MRTQDYIKKLERDLVLKNYSPRSIATYTAHVRQFLNHFEGQWCYYYPKPLEYSKPKALMDRTLCGNKVH